MPQPPWPYPLPVEGVSTRDPDWVLLEECPGTGGGVRTVYWDWIHGWIKVEAPTVVVNPPIAPL